MQKNHRTIIEEWKEKFWSLCLLSQDELDKVTHYVACQRNQHVGELCGCEVSAMMNKAQQVMVDAMEAAARGVAEAGRVEKKDTSKYERKEKRTGEVRYIGTAQCRNCMKYRDSEERSFNAAISQSQKQLTSHFEDV